MSDTLSDALAAFGAGPAEPADAARLKGASKEALLQLIAELAAAERRAHLEALGRAGLGKEIKKAARKAAYKLKSAGVEGEVRGGPALDLKRQVKLDGCALVAAPGLRGVGWIALGEMPGADPCEVVQEDGGQAGRVTVLESLSPGRLRKFMRDLSDDDERGTRPVMCDAAAAAALIVRFGDTFRAAGGAFPAHWSHVLRWREQAIAHGAAAEAGARAALGADAATLDINLQRTTAALTEVAEAGPLVPPDAVINAVLEEVGEAVKSPLELSETQFHQRIEGLVDSAADSWLAAEAVRELVAGWLETCADIVWAAEKREPAMQLLWVADQLATGDVLPHELDLIRTSFLRIVDLDLAWQTYGAHHGLPIGPEEEEDDDDDDEPSGGIILP